MIRSPGTEAAANQSIHEMSIPHRSLANCVEATLVDDAVIKIQALVRAALYHTYIKKAPVLEFFPPGTHPSVEQMDCAIGKTIPPPRAVFEGVKGEAMRSVAVKT